MESDAVRLPLSDRLWAWFDTNKKPALASTAVVLVVGLIIWFSAWRHGERQAAAGDAISKVALTQLETGGMRPQTEEYLKVARDYAGTEAAARATLLAGSAYFSEAKYDNAREQFEQFMRQYPGSPMLGQALLGVAACADAQGKADQAVTAYENLINSRPNDNATPGAKFALARIYENQNKPEKARNLYEGLAQTMAYTSIGNESGVRLEELFEKYPQLAPPPPTPMIPANSPESISNALMQAIQRAGTNGAVQETPSGATNPPPSGNAPADSTNASPPTNLTPAPASNAPAASTSTPPQPEQK
jgi:outer membrane protein assembly factor BamD (BamD/ComL family)